MKQEGTNRSGISMIVITVFFLGCFLTLILFGTGIYRSVADAHSHSSSRRALLSYLLTVSRVNESDIRTEDGEFGTMLVIADGDTGYAVRIYAADGHLLEDYGKLGGKLYPDAASAIAETDVFEVQTVRPGLLEVTTSEGTVFLHTGQEGGPAE